MTRRAKIGAFLTLDQNWDPSLLFVLGVGVLVNLILFNYFIRVRYNIGYSENKLVLEKLFLLFQVTALIGNLLLELYALDQDGELDLCVQVHSLCCFRYSLFKLEYAGDQLVLRECLWLIFLPKQMLRIFQFILISLKRDIDMIYIQ